MLSAFDFADPDLRHRTANRDERASAGAAAAQRRVRCGVLLSLRGKRRSNCSSMHRATTRPRQWAYRTVLACRSFLRRT
ncbi:MAG: hypothetical protein R3B90_19870 [Planctomycetaceae bacterium]